MPAKEQSKERITIHVATADERRFFTDLFFVIEMLRVVSKEANKSIGLGEENEIISYITNLKEQRVCRFGILVYHFFAHSC